MYVKTLFPWGLGVVALLVQTSLTMRLLYQALAPWPGALPLVWVLGVALCALPCAKLTSSVQQLVRSRNQPTNARALLYHAQEYAKSAFGYSIMMCVVLVAIMFALANQGILLQTFFRLDLMKNALPDTLNAAKVNVLIVLISSVCSMVWGLLVAIAKIAPGPSGKPFRMIAKAYTDIFLSLPAVIVIYLVGFGLPLVQLKVLENVPLEVLICLALTLTYGAYLAEAYRAGLESIHPSQWSAARSLGLSYQQTLTSVVVPQALRRSVPPLLTNLISLQKDSALVGFVGVVDIFNQSKIMASNDFNLSAVMLVAAVFLLVTIPQTRLVDYLMAKETQKRS